jgi:hypothetical protein
MFYPVMTVTSARIQDLVYLVDQNLISVSLICWFSDE